MNTWIEKQLYITDFTLSSMLRRKGRNVSLLAVYTSIIMMLASVMLFSNAIRHEAVILLENSPEVVVQRMTAGRHELVPVHYIEKIGSIRGTRNVEGRLWGYYFDSSVASNYTFMVPAERDIELGTIVIGNGIARTRGMGEGDILSVHAYDGSPIILRVAEVMDPDSELLTADLVLISEANFRQLLGVPADMFTDIVVSVSNPSEMNTVAEKIRTLLPDSRPILRDEILRTYDSVFNWREGLTMVMLVGALLAFIIFAWDKASGLSAEERREIGILKAIGWETSDVIKLRFVEGATVSLGAFLLGYIGAYIHVFYFGAALFNPVLAGWAVLYPSFRLTPFIDGFQVTTLLLLTVFPYTVATIFPIWRSAIVDPDIVMR